MEYRVPQTEAELRECLADPMWRLCSGYLYKIMVKGDGGEENLVQPFIPNKTQQRLIRRLWHRNIIPKARQLGITTVACILWLDTALFVENMRCGIIAQDEQAAKAIFRDKVKFAYEQLPPPLRAAMPLQRDSADELLFAHNNSSIRVATSMRSGTIHRLHVSEFGKICAKFPDKAQEVITGSLPAVPTTGIVIIESTAEGRDGDYYRMVQRAKAMKDAGKELSNKEFRLHFFPWWQEPRYAIPADSVSLSPRDEEYFSNTEAVIGRVLTPEQRAWYVTTRDNDLNGDVARMWQEYPSTLDESFQVSTEGCWLTAQMSAARKDGRITKIPLLPSVPCNTFWDIGNSDGTAIWLHQRVGAEDRFVRFYEAWGEPYSHAATWLQSLGVTFDTHYLPHDADHVRQGQHANKSPRMMLEELLPGHRFVTVDRTPDITAGIQQLRDAFSGYWFDETACREGLAHLDGYKKTWNTRAATWQDIPYKLDGHSEAADALRQHAQGYRKTSTSGKGRSRPHWAA